MGRSRRLRRERSGQVEACQSAPKAQGVRESRFCKCLSRLEFFWVTVSICRKNTITPVQKAIAVSTGRRLDVVRMFTSERELPDLTSLVINKGSGECGSGFTRHFDPVAAREVVFGFDWSTVSLDFDGFVKATETAVKPRKKVKEQRALELMAAYFREHRSSLPPSIRERRELIVELIMEGFSEEDAFAEACRA